MFTLNNLGAITMPLLVFLMNAIPPLTGAEGFSELGVMGFFGWMMLKKDSQISAERKLYINLFTRLLDKDFNHNLIEEDNE